MPKTTEPLNSEDKFIIADILDIITGDSDLIKGFRQQTSTTTRQLDRLAMRVRNEAKKDAGIGT